MVMKRGLSGKEKGLAAATRRFPDAEFSIRKLMAHSEAFCDMCEELAEAEFALSKVPEARPELREARRAEWQELVDLLAAEVEAALR
jgi:hypothetical protein